MKKYIFRGIEFSVKELETYIKGIKSKLKKDTLHSIIVSENPKELIKHVNKLKSLQILSFDPGPKNFAYAIISDKITTGMVLNPINILKDTDIFYSQIKAFSKEIKTIMSKIDYIIIERFTARGRFGGFMSECVNIMIGIIITRFIAGKVILITAAQHKNFFKHTYSIKTANFQNKVITKKIAVHEKDAIMIGFYFLFTMGYSRTLIKKMIANYNRI